MSKFESIKSFLAYTWFMWGALIGSVLIFRFFIASPFLSAMGWEKLYGTELEFFASVIISVLIMSKGLDHLKVKIREEHESDS